mmetsp:Transcript_7193/g.16657  ORF Transcript_7193/g.16657 Transcript_7193/m.16657 type:complete len:238 (+) Transcript_7193:276-989(+)
MLLHPRMTLTKAETSSGLARTGVMDAYVSSSESWTFTALSVGMDGAPCVPLSPSRLGREGAARTDMRRGRSLYASGPTTTSAVPCSNMSSLRRSAMQPSTPMMRFLPPRRPAWACFLASFVRPMRPSPFVPSSPSSGKFRSWARSVCSRCQTLRSALSRMAHVFVSAARTKSARPRPSSLMRRLAFVASSSAAGEEIESHRATPARADGGSLRRAPREERMPAARFIDLAGYDTSTE